jgi:multisubunit Na+/H+ antiporter MnhB subunit
MMLAVLDVTLAGATVWLAWKAVSDDHAFRAIVHFISMGLLVALAWVRLRAPDVAIAEAAVGAGLTGALVMSGAASLLPADGVPLRSGECRDRDSRARLRGFVSAIVSLGVFAVVAYALLSIPNEPAGLTKEAVANLKDSGVLNPVTAALMNYRAYDTLLEIAVLLIAVVGVWSVGTAHAESTDVLDGRPLFSTLVRIVIPGLVIAAGYLLWRGGFAPGGAFQGGALLGGICVLAIVGGLAHRALEHPAVIRFGLAAGTLTFVAVAVGASAVGGNLLEYRGGGAKVWILVVESVAMLSIGLTLGALYLGGRPQASDEDSAQGGSR